MNATLYVKLYFAKENGVIISVAMVNVGNFEKFTDRAAYQLLHDMMVQSSQKMSAPCIKAEWIPAAEAKDVVDAINNSHLFDDDLPDQESEPTPD